MRLSREAIQRMVGDRVGGGSAGGGGSAISIDDIQGMGFVTEQFVGEHYVSIDFFRRLFKTYDQETTPGEVQPNDLDTLISRIEALFDFNSVGGVSSLGYSPGGGGGGTDLNALLDSINTSAIGSVAPTTAQIGKCLVWTADGWAWGTTGGGGGGGTVTSITAGTGLSGGTITTSGTIAISTEYQTRISNGQTAYGWGNHAEAGYAKASDLSDYLPLIGGTLTGALHMGSTAGASPFIYWGDGTYAYIGEDADDHITLRGDKGVNILTGSTYALSWNGDKLATQAWVENQGFVKSSGVTSVGLSVPTGFTVSGSPVTTSGTLALGIASGYFMPTTTQRSTWNGKQDAISDLATIRSNASHGETAYGWGNHANAGYMLRTEGMRFLVQDAYVAARFVTATGASDATRAAKAQGDGYIEWWSDGGYFNHEMGFIRAKGNVEVGTGTTDTAHYLQIGGGRLFWDNTNKALYVQQADGTAAHFYATGGVSALGMSVGGTPSLNTLTLETLTVTDSITVGTNGILISDPDGDGMIYSSGGTLTLGCDEGILANNELTVNGALYMLGNDILKAGGVYGTSLHSSGMVYLNQELAALAYNKNTGQLILRTRTSTSGAWTDHIISMN